MNLAEEMQAELEEEKRLYASEDPIKQTKEVLEYRKTANEQKQTPCQPWRCSYD